MTHPLRSVPRSASSPLPSQPRPVARPQIAPPRRQLSRSNVLAGRGAGIVGGPARGKVDRAAFVDWFRPAFSAWLRAHHPSPEVVAATFGVRFQTALNWWNGENTASGDIVAAAFLSVPDAMAWFLTEWGDR